MQGLVRAMLHGYGLCIRNPLANSEDIAASVSWDIVSPNEAFVTLYRQTGEAEHDKEVLVTDVG